MPFSLEWYVPQRVLYCQVEGEINLDDAQILAQVMNDHIQTGIAPVHAIFDVSRMTKFPTSVSQVNAMSRWVYHDNTGWIITINAGRVMAFMTTIVTNMAGVKHRTAVDLADAINVLRRMDISLPTSSVS